MSGSTEDQLAQRPLSVPILARGSFRQAGVVVPLVGGLLLAAQATNPHAPEAMGYLAAVCFAISGVMVLLLWGRHRWLEVALTGFVLRDPFRTIAFRDEDVVGLTLDERSSGKTAVVLEVLVRGLRRFVRLDYAWPTAEGDPPRGAVEAPRAVRLWVSEEADARVRLPAHEHNAVVLYRLVRLLLGEAPAADDRVREA